MIQISAKEKQILEKLYPEYSYPRTMKHDSKRHHYFCTESEKLMRAIADTNFQAAEMIREYDRRKALAEARRKRAGDR